MVTNLKYKSTIALHDSLYFLTVYQMLLFLLFYPLLVELYDVCYLLRLLLIIALVELIFERSDLSLFGFPVLQFLLEVVITQLVVIFWVFPGVVFPQSVLDVFVEIFFNGISVDGKDCGVLADGDLFTSSRDIFHYF